MRSKRDIKMGRLCTPGGAVLGIVGGGVRFRFFNGEAIFEEYMLFWYVYTLLWLSWKSYSISVYNGQNHMGFMKKSIAFGVPPAYSRYRGLCTRGEKLVDFVLTSQGIWNVKICHQLQ